jgi:hypothetical protein
MAEPAMSELAREAFLADLHVGVLAVASGDERPPLCTPIWYHYVPGGDLTFYTGGEGEPNRKMRLIRQAGAVTFTVQEEEQPYRYVSIEGSVREDANPPREDFLAIIERYLGAEGAEQFIDKFIGPGAVIYHVTPTRWRSVDFSQ